MRNIVHKFDALQVVSFFLLLGITPYSAFGQSHSMLAYDAFIDDVDKVEGIHIYGFSDAISPTKPRTPRLPESLGNITTGRCQPDLNLYADLDQCLRAIQSKNSVGDVSWVCISYIDLTENPRIILNALKRLNPEHLITFRSSCPASLLQSFSREITHVHLVATGITKADDDRGK